VGAVGADDYGGACGGEIVNKYKIMKKGESNPNRAIWAVVIGVAITIALLCFIVFNNGQKFFSEKTGYTGDTIGGIAGPILNIIGLIVVYFSLKEQFIANTVQGNHLRDEIISSRNDKHFEFTFKLFEMLSVFLERNDDFLSRIAELDFERYKVGKQSDKNKDTVRG